MVIEHNLIIDFKLSVNSGVVAVVAGILDALENWLKCIDEVYSVGNLVVKLMRELEIGKLITFEHLFALVHIIQVLAGSLLEHVENKVHEDDVGSLGSNFMANHAARHLKLVHNDDLIDFVTLLVVLMEDLDGALYVVEIAFNLSLELEANIISLFLVGILVRLFALDKLSFIINWLVVAFANG